MQKAPRKFWQRMNIKFHKGFIGSKVAKISKNKKGKKDKQKAPQKFWQRVNIQFALARFSAGSSMFALLANLLSFLIYLTSRNALSFPICKRSLLD